MQQIITLTTDFGTSGPYVGAMKGAILSHADNVTLVDITHQIEPQNVLAGAILLAQSTPWFPAGTIHVAVIDPGVGTDRSILYFETDNQNYLVPDNGLISFVLQSTSLKRVTRLKNVALLTHQPSNTFHGRDIFAPLAAALAQGKDIREFGPQIDQWVQLTIPTPHFLHNQLHGTIIFIDPFGNLLTNIRPTDLPILSTNQQWKWECRSQTTTQFVKTYGAAKLGELVALESSFEFCELAIVNGNAAQQLQATVGSPITVACVECKK